MNDGKLIQGNSLLRFFLRLVGGDYGLLLRSGRSIVRKHYIASLLLLVVFVISTLSVFYATDLLFNSWKVEICMSAFISLLFGCIYIFLLTTFTKLIKGAPLFTLSNVTRTGFVIFMGFLISKPVEVFIFSSSLDTAVTQYRSKLITNYSTKLYELTKNDQTFLKKELQFLTKRKMNFRSNDDEVRIAELTKSVEKLNEHNEVILSIAERRITESAFLLFQIQKLASKPVSWLVSLLIIILFLLPGFIIYSIPADHIYYTSKHELENKLILQEYAQFLIHYKQVFSGIWKMSAEPYTKFTDPPFNTIRIPKPESLTNADFITKYLR